MQRIVYLAFSSGGLQGGHKMTFRHVEALRSLGFNAVIQMGRDNPSPTWFEHDAPVERPPIVTANDVVVVPDDSFVTLRQVAGLDVPTVVFWQTLAPSVRDSIENLQFFPADRLPSMMAVSEGLATLVRRLYPAAQVEVVPCFADERRFGRGAAKRSAVAYAPRKRPAEAKAVTALARRLHPQLQSVEWIELASCTETEVAQAFGAATLHLSLSRLESVGMTALEAMLSGCICAGFLGVGGREYGTPSNGVWVPDDDLVAAADALAQAEDIVRTAGASFRSMIQAGQTTASQWSHARFVDRLETFWMEIAPGARVRNGPLD